MAQEQKNVLTDLSRSLRDLSLCLSKHIWLVGWGGGSHALKTMLAPHSYSK